MINLNDILDMSCLTREEIAAVAEHEHISRVNATLKAEWMMQRHKGAHRIEQMICEDIREALHRDDLDHARELYNTLRAFVADHPEAVRGA